LEDVLPLDLCEFNFLFFVFFLTFSFKGGLRLAYSIEVIYGLILGMYFFVQHI